MSWLKDSRLNARLSQDQVCAILDISRPTYARLENDPGLMTLKQGAALKAAGITIVFTDFVAVDCPVCNGGGILYKPMEK